MASSLFTALSGLKAHEDWLTVIGNNISNTNTPGFKSSRATFSDLFSQTLRFASLPSGNLGGRNPVQVGSGVQLADIGRDFGQGALNNTGRTFDLALNGKGFFVVNDGVRNLYTRVGTFGLDGNSRVVDQRTGFLVQDPSGSPITIDTNEVLPPQATGSVSFAGNLPAEVTGPLAQELTTTSGLTEGSPAQLTGTVDGSGGLAIPAGETWTMDIVVDGGAPQQIAFTGPGPYTTTDFVNAINALGAGVTATDVGGFLELTTQRTGQVASIKVQPGAPGRDLAGLIGLSTSLVTGSETTASLTTPLNSLPSNITDYVPGDVINISGVDGDGTPISASFAFGPTPPAEDGTTVGDLVNFIDNLYTTATASFDATSGQILLTSDVTGQSGLTMAMADGTPSIKTNWPEHAFVATTVGTGPDVATTAIEVYDQSGAAHTMTFSYERQDDGSWNVTPTLPNGSVSPATISGLRFNDDGTVQSLPANTSVSVTFPGQSSTQTIALDLGSPAMLDGLTQFGEPSSLFVEAQDGFGVGSLANMSVNSNGDVQGFYSNGQIQILGEIGVATFVNDNGLEEVGDNLWSETANSGARTIGKGATGTAAQVVAGALEASNVEIAGEFVNLIEAQRGFQANARMISTTDEVLAELVNLL